MLNHYVKNRGISQTLVHTNGKNSFQQVNWDTEYDGDKANISVVANIDGNEDKMNIHLTSEDLDTLLNVPSVDMPLDQRLLTDFGSSSSEPLSLPMSMYQIEFPRENRNRRHTSSHRIQKSSRSKHTTPRTHTNHKSVSLHSPSISNYLSSPKSTEELLVPIEIEEDLFDNYTFTPNRQHKRKKTHKTYKVYKKHKTSTSKKHTRSKSRKTSASFLSVL